MSKNCKNCITSDDVSGAIAVAIVAAALLLIGYLFGGTSSTEIGRIKNNAFRCGKLHANSYHTEYYESVCGP